MSATMNLCDTKLPASLSGNTHTVKGNSMLPLYRHGDKLIVVPDVPVKTGDRVFVEIVDSAPLGGTLIHRDDKDLIIKVGGTSRKSMVLNISQVKSVARVIWASQ